MPTVTYQVGQSSDDAVSSASGSFLNVNATFFSSSGGTYVTGFRFTGVAVPQGATVDSAYLKVTGTNDADSATLYLKGEAADNPVTFAAGVRPDQRTKTSAVSAQWSIPGSSTGVLTSPDVASVVQEIVNRPGWSSGNALVLLSDTVSSGGCSVVDYNTTPASAAQLEITYTAGGGSPARTADFLAFF